MVRKFAKWCALTLCVLGLLYCTASPVAAADITVGTNGCSLFDAITAANRDQAVGACPAGSGADKIILQGNVEISAINNSDFGGGNALPTITSEIRLEGRGYKISRRTVGPLFYRILSVAETGYLTLWQVTLANGYFQDQPGAYGAGIYNRGRLTIESSTLLGHKNSAATGGAIYNEGSLLIRNSTVSENWSAVSGDAIYNKGGSVQIQATTFSSNSTVNSGGSDIYNNSGRITILASILANSVKAKCGGPISSLGYNIISDASCNFLSIGDRNNTDPLLGALRDNGNASWPQATSSSSPALWTHALAAGSPAIDAIPVAGFCTQLGIDQRGVIRPQGSGCDSGAFEVTTGADNIAPTISAALATNPNAEGWYNQDAVIRYTCIDNVGGSGLAATACPGNSAVWWDKAGVVTDDPTVRDLAGNVSQPSNVFTVNVDKTVPAVWAFATTNANGDGWYNRDVTIRFVCTDALSGVANCPADQILSTEGAAISSTPQTITDRAGNAAISNIVTVKIDKRITPPPVAAASWQGRTLASGAASPIAFASALALDRDGNPVISYYNSASKQLWLVHCDTLACVSNPSAALVDTGGDAGRYNALVLDASGNPVISYYDAINKVLKVRRCVDANCVGGGAPLVVDNLGAVGWHPAMQLDSSGNPVISYYDFTNGDLKVAHCGSADCASGNTLQTVDSTGAVGLDTALALDSSGNPVVSYYDTTNGDLKLVRCGNATCTSSNVIQTVDSTGDVGRYTSLKLDSAGNPVISYYDASNGDLKLVRCGNATCTSGNTIQIVDGTGAVGQYTSMGLDSAGNPAISYYDATNGDLKLVRCGNGTCASGNNIQTIVSAGTVGQYPALRLDSSGNAVISYASMNTNANALALTRQVGDTTPPVITPNVVGPLGNRGWYKGEVTVSWTVLDGETPLTSQSGCTPTKVTGAKAVTLTCLATSSGGTSSHSVTLGRDPVAPTLTFVNRTPPNSAGWNNSDVVANWNCSDTASGPLTPTVSVTFSSEGKSRVIYAKCTDNAGNTSSAAQPWINLDKTPPLITAAATTNPNANGWYTGDVTIHFTCTDSANGSGIAAGVCPADQILSTQQGIVASSPQTVSDLAGNLSVPSNIVSVQIDKTLANQGVAASAASDITPTVTLSPSQAAFTVMLPIILVDDNGMQGAASAIPAIPAATATVTVTMVVTSSPALSQVATPTANATVTESLPISVPVVTTPVITESVPVSLPVEITPVITESLPVSVPVAAMASTVVTATATITTTQNVTSAAASEQSNSLFLPLINNTNALAGTVVGSLDGITPFLLVALVLITVLLWINRQRHMKR